MSDSSGRKKRSNKTSGSPASSPSGSMKVQTEDEYNYNSGKMKTMYSEAFGEDDGLLEVLRPMQKPRSKEEQRRSSAKSKPKERNISADYSYQYDFSEVSSPSGRSGKSGGHKTQKNVTSRDLASVLSKLSVESIKDEVAKWSASNSDPVASFSSLVQSLETLLLQAKLEVHSTNQEKWASFNTPIGDVDVEIVEFLNDWVETNLNSEQQTSAARLLIKRMIENVDRPINNSAGYGLKLAAQVLFRKSAWALLESLDVIKSPLPRIGALHSLPDKYAPIVIFIGAQLLANTEDPDAPFAGFAFALEILGFSGLSSKDSMCNEFIARAYSRYRKAHGTTIDEYHIRLPAKVAERAAFDLARVSASKNPGYDSLRPVLPGLQELVIHMGLLSSSEKQITEFFNKVAIHSAPICAQVLSELSPQSIERYDNLCKNAVKRLVGDLGRQIQGRGPKNLPPLDPVLQSEVTSLLKRFDGHVNIQASAAPSSPSTKQKKHARVNHIHDDGSSRRRRHSSFCGTIFRLILLAGFIYGCIFFWRHYVDPTTKETLHKLTTPICEATKPYVRLAKDSFNSARAAAQPHISTAYKAVKPHLDTVCASVKPHMDTAWKAIEPHYNTVHSAILHYIEVAKPHLEQSCKTAEPYVELAKEKSIEAWRFSLIKIQEFWVFSQPHIQTGLAHGRQYLAVVGKYLDQLPGVVCNAYKTHVAPTVNPLLDQAKQAVTPYTTPAFEAIAPYWSLFLEKLHQLGLLIDTAFNMK